jgi:GntR family histidine utilization transcriptional repressor
MSRDALALPLNTAQPLYQQIKESILDKIRSGSWMPGLKIPSEHNLVADLGISRMTVHRALRELTRDGYLDRVHGLGTFVSEPPSVASLIELRNIADEIQSQGKTHRAKLHTLRETTASKDIAKRMEIKPGTRVFHIILIHYQDEIPIQIENRYLNPAWAPEFMQVDFEHTTPGEYLIQLFQPDEMEHVVQAILPDKPMCKMLAIDATEPCLRMQRRTWKQGAVVTLVTFTYPGSRYDLAARYNASDIRKSHPSSDSEPSS